MTTESSVVFTQLGKNSLLDVVPGLQELIVDKGQVRVIDKNLELAKQGQPVKYLLIPLNHGLRLYRHQDGARSPVGALKQQRSLALRELLAEEPYAYSAFTEAATSVLILPAADFRALVARQPELLHYLQLITGSNGARRFKTFLSEKKVSNADIVALLGLLPEQTQTVPVGEDLPGDCLCFVDHGRVRIDRHQVKTYVEEGDFFGGEALVSPGSWNYTARPTQASEVRLVRAKEMKALLVDPSVVDALFEEPCLSARGDESTRTSVGPALSELPGEVVPAERIALHFDTRQLHAAETDAESFAASASNILLFLGLPTNLANFEMDMAEIGRLSALRVAELLEPLGVVCRPGKGALRAQRATLAVVSGRLVIVLQVTESQVLVHDPARGFVRVARSDFRKRWDGAFLECHRDDHRHSPPLDINEKPTARRVVFELGMSILSENRTVLLVIAGLSLLGIGVSMLGPFLSQLILDNALTLRDMRVLWSCAVGMVLVMLLSATLAFLEARLSVDFSTDFERKFSVALYRRGLQLPLHAFAEHKAGDMLSRLSELQVIQHFLSLGSLQAVLDVVTIVFSAGILALFSGKAALVAAAIAMLTVGMQALARLSLRRLYQRAFLAGREGTSLLAEQIGAIGTVKATGAEQTMMRRWEGAYLRALDSNYRAGLVQISASTLVKVLGQLARLAGLWLAAREALAGSLSYGQIFAVSLYLNQLVGGLLSIGSFLAQLQRVFVSFDKVGEVIAHPSFLAHRGDTTMSVSLKGKVRFEGVSFRYGSESEWAVREVSFTIYPRQVVALVGRSGCGKTTLAHLLAGQLRPTSGRIFFDNYDQTFLSPVALTRQIGFVMQANDLFQASVGENLTYTDDAPDLARCQSTVEQAAALEFIASHPGGFERYLGEGGLGLSGGQKQRLSLARTLYRDPRILILDEATSSLDAAAERAIAGNMRDILRGRTSLVIAHRLSTIRHADLILVMRDGQIVEQGSHQSLLASGGHYAELFAGQTQGNFA